MNFSVKKRTSKDKGSPPNGANSISVPKTLIIDFFVHFFLSKWALKSLFHAIRIYMFGILLGTYGFINDWEIANEQLEILMKTEDSAKLDMAFFKNYMLAPKMQEMLNNFKEALPNDFASHLTACGYNKEQVKAIKLREDVFGLMGISPYDDFE